MASPFIPDPNASDYQDSINTEQQYLDAVRQNSVLAQQQAALISQQRLASPGIPAGSYQSLAGAGASPNNPSYQLIAARYVPRTDTNSIRYSAFDGAGGSIVTKGRSAGAFLDASGKPIPEPAHHDDGWSWNPLHDAAQVASDTADAASTAYDWTKTEVLRPTARWLGAAASYPYEVMQNAAGIATASQRGDFGAATDWRSYANALGPSTTLGQDIAHGSGTGWFSTTPENQARLQHLQTVLRGMNSAGGAWQVGNSGPEGLNMIGRSVFHHDFITPGSVAYGVTSGITDLLIARKLDPANLLFSQWHDASIAHDIFDVNPEARDAGALSALRNMVNPVRFDKWLQTGKGQRVASQLAGLDNAGEIWDRMGGKIPAMLAHQLSEAQTPDEVSSLLRDAVGTEFKYVPTVSHFGGIGGAPYAVRSFLRDPRMLAQMPEYGILLSNPDQAMKNLNLLMIDAKLPQDVRYQRLAEFAKVVGDPNSPALGPGAYKAIVDGVGSDIERKLAGNAWFQGRDATNLANDIYSARSNPDFPSTLREALRTELPRVNFTNEHFDDLQNLVSGAADENNARDRILAYLSGDDKLAALPEDVADRAGVAALGRSYVSPEAARKLSTFYNSADTNLTTRWYDASSPGAAPGHIEINGQLHPVEGPFSVNEHLQNYVPLPDARRIREATTLFPNLLGWVPGDHMMNPFLTADGERRLWLKAAEGVNSLWRRTVVLTRPAVMLRMLANEQLAASVDGTETWFSHPYRNLANMIGGHDADPNIDMFDKSFAETLADRHSAFSRASAINNDPLVDHPDRMFLRAYGPIGRDTRDPNVYLHAWGRELSRTMIEPIDAPVADALRQGVTIGDNGIKVVDADARATAIGDVQDRFWDGNLSQYRKSLAAGSDGGPHDWRAALRDRDGADAYIEAVKDRVSGLTAEDPKLLDAMVEKTFNGDSITKAIGTKNTLSPDFLDHLSGLRDNGLGPLTVRGQLSILHPDGASGLGASYDQAMSWLFDHTIGIPSTKLMRSPAFTDAYWKEVQRLTPTLDDNARQVIADALSNGDTTRLPSQVSRSQYLTAAEADLLAKNTALDKVQQLFYNAHSRSNFGDVNRILIPFAEVFRQEIKRWLTLAPQNLPLIVRRLGQLNGTLRQSALLAPDPQTGKESIHIPIPGWAQQAAGAIATGTSALTVPFGGQFTNSIGGPTVSNASVSINPLNASLVAQGLPGVGAVASLPVDEIMRRIPGTDSIRQTVLPFGGTDTRAGVGDAILSTFTPSWLHSVMNSQLGAGASRNAQTMADVISYLQSARPDKYGNTPQGRQKLLDDATEISHKLWIVKAIAQATSPASGPRISVNTKTNQGWTELESLAKDWRATLDESYASGGTSLDATRKFIDRYGVSAGMALTNETESRIYGLAATSQMREWRDANPDLVRDYPDVWPLLAGQPKNANGGVDYLSIQRQVSDNERISLNPRERLELSDYRLGQFVYDHYRTMLPATPNHLQQQWLDRVKVAISQRYPGWAAGGMGQWPKDIPQRADRNYIITNELAPMLADPRLKDSPVATAIGLYVGFRNQAITALGAQNDANPSQSLTSKRATATRTWLAGIAERILRQYPQFAPVWDSLFRSEVTPKDPSGAQSVQDSGLDQAATGGTNG